MSFEILPVWKQMTPALAAELATFWISNGALATPAAAAERAKQAVCVARGEDGALCAVSTAAVRVLPRLRQPMYYYRHFFAEPVRGQRQTKPFFNRSRAVLEAYHATLSQPESLGVLLELESSVLASAYAHTPAYIEPLNLTFIGYSPRGYQLHVAYFKDALLLPPVDVP